MRGWNCQRTTLRGPIQSDPSRISIRGGLLDGNLLHRDVGLNTRHGRVRGGNGWTLLCERLRRYGGCFVND
jgi:hypothetical protein